MLKQGSAEPGDRLSCFAAELTQDAGWCEPAAGSEYVRHVASRISEHEERRRKRAPFDETTWTDPRAGDVLPYARSKTLAERAAWDFVAKEGPGLELSVVCPVLVLRPLLTRDFSPSTALVQRLLEGPVSGWPRLYMGIVDVRDVADLHVRAMTDPAAKGERFSPSPAISCRSVTSPPC